MNSLIYCTLYQLLSTLKVVALTLVMEQYVQALRRILIWEMNTDLYGNFLHYLTDHAMSLRGIEILNTAAQYL